jgi:hypothetical protein
MSREPASGSVEPEDPPPLLGSWRNLYWLVVGELGLLVLLFYALTRWAS